MMRAFALVHRAEDRALTPPDVQKIAEAFLLWNGNHSWKVINVRPDGDVIGFDLATAEGSVIAHFTMDPKTARLARKVVTLPRVSIGLHGGGADCSRRRRRLFRVATFAPTIARCRFPIRPHRPGPRCRR